MLYNRLFCGFSDDYFLQRFAPVFRVMSAHRVCQRRNADGVYSTPLNNQGFMFRQSAGENVNPWLLSRRVQIFYPLGFGCFVCILQMRGGAMARPFAHVLDLPVARVNVEVDVKSEAFGNFWGNFHSP